MASGGVPRIGTPAACNLAARFSGVCPPNCTITPMQFARGLLPLDDIQHILQVNGSK